MNKGNLEEFTIIYDELVENIPTVLSSECNIQFENENEKKLIQTYLLLNNSKLNNSNNSVKNKIDRKDSDLNLDSLYKKGYFNGAISFSMNKEKRDYLCLMLFFLESVYKHKEDLLTILDVIKFIEVFRNTFLKYLKLIDKKEERCIFNEIIIITKNDPNVSVTIERICDGLKKKNMLRKSEECSIPCDDNSKSLLVETECKLSVEEIEKVLKSLTTKKILRKNEHNYYVMG